ncbi:MAG: response regulator [Desulfovibrionales bacterium]|nr:response regulator [Desulfovibrionales bacterium]
MSAGTIRVLLVDDETQFAAILAKRLRRKGFVVTMAGSGPEGLGQLETDPVDVVVLDVNMPGMDGIQVLREIRMRHPLVQILMLTGHADMESAISGMAMGAYDYLMKPADLEDLVRKLRDAGDRSRQLDEESGLDVPPA